MLLWQQNMHEYDDAYYHVRWDVARRSLVYACCVYLFFFLILVIASFFTTKAPVEPVVIRVQNAPVLFTGSSRKSGKGSAHGNVSASKAARQPQTVAQKIDKKKVAEPVKKKKERKKAEKKEKPQPQVKEKQQPKPKPVEKVQASQKKVIAPPKKEEAPQKKNELKKQEPQKSEAKPVKHEESQKPAEPVQNAVSQKEEPVVAQPEEIATIVAGAGINDSDVEGAYDAQTKSHMALSRAIARAWKAPQVSIKNPAHMMVELDGAGKPTVIEFEKKSGIVIYDIEARAAIMRAEFPQEFWGKKFIIIFGE